MQRKPEIRYINAYVSGSLAYQMETKPVQKKRTVKLPKPRREKKAMVVIDPISVSAIAVSALMLVLMVVGFFQLQNARSEARVMENYVYNLQQENQSLSDTYASGYDLEEIEQIALAMGMIPQSQAAQMSVTVVMPPVVEEPTAWESFCAFLTGLFA